MKVRDGRRSGGRRGRESSRGEEGESKRAHESRKMHVMSTNVYTFSVITPLTVLLTPHIP